MVAVRVSQGSARPYQYRGAAYRRVGNTTVAMSADEYNRMLFERMHTTDPTGRMFLGILITFAQYEREVIAERIRDKVAAAKRRGKYCGARPSSATTWTGSERSCSSIRRKRRWSSTSSGASPCYGATPAPASQVVD